VLGEQVTAESKVTAERARLLLRCKVTAERARLLLREGVFRLPLGLDDATPCLDDATRD